MSLLQDSFSMAYLPSDWCPAWEGLHPTVDGMGFTLDWTYPWTMRLSNGKTKTFKSYLQHSNFVRKATLHYRSNGTKHPSVN